MKKLFLSLLLAAGISPAFAQTFEPVCRTSDCGAGAPIETVCRSACGLSDIVLAENTAPATLPTLHHAVPKVARHAAAASTAPAASSSKLTQSQATQNPVLVLQNFTLTDLQAALADANAQTPPDTIAATCYQALITLVGNPVTNPLPSGPGAFQLFQKGRDVKNLLANLQAQNGPLSTLNVACAPLIVDLNTTLVRLGIMGGAVVGSGGLILGSSAPSGNSLLAFQQQRDKVITAAAAE